MLENYEIIKNEISKKFPTLNIFLEKTSETNEYFILIDDPKIYNSPSYLEFVLKTKLDFLWPRNINNVYFAYETNVENNIIKFDLAQTSGYAYKTVDNDLNMQINEFVFSAHASDLPEAA